MTIRYFELYFVLKFAIIQGMNKKDIKLIGILIIIAGIALLILKMISGNTHAEKGIVECDGEVILTFDLEKDEIYSFDGSYGHMQLEVKDKKFRVINVECPNHNCEEMGWKDESSLSPITCLPNKVVVYAKSE